MICMRCWCVFCWDDADEATLTGHRKRFCSAKCQKKGPRRRACDVCDSEFTPETPDQRRCSDPCREFARKYRDYRRDLWNRERARMGFFTCPSGKVRHETKRDAEKAAKSSGFLRYDGFRRNWLNVYECSQCFGGWHLTSKPQGSRPGAKRAAAAS